jgi:cob(I)alamin adenosyltransferase
MLERGIIQVFTGDGKGKTTAALGLALRAAGQGLKVTLYQFLKPPDLETGERKALLALADRIQLEVVDAPWDMATSTTDRQACARMAAAVGCALEQAGQIAEKGLCDVLILDEIVFCLARDLVGIADIRRLVSRRASHVEVVMTGRGATAELVALADLVTEMQPVKHPLEKGLGARRGIEY